ncbi:MAG: rhomboid family intramembrane serine protease, partial [Proteobacteria bacterium]
LGAHYAARTNATELWRFATSFFVHDELILALLNAVSLLWIGWHLSREIGPFFFIGALFICQIAASFTASEIDLQALYYGAAGAVVGVSAMALSLQRWKFLKSRDVVALSAIFFHTGVTLLAATEGAVVGLESIAAAGLAGLGLGAGTHLLRRLTTLQSFRIQKAAPVFCASLIAVSMAIGASELRAPEDVIGSLKIAREKRDLLTDRLAELEANRTSGLMSAGEFANRIQDDVLQPIEKATDEIEVLLRARSSHARWLETERRDGNVKVLGLEIISTVYRAKEHLLTARDQITAGETSPELETFWRQTAPLLSRQIKSLYEMSAKSAAQKMLVKARTAASNDLHDLEATATDLEIMQGELFLTRLRSLAFDQQVVTDSRKPASEPDWSEISSEIRSHQQRLEMVSSRVSTRSEKASSRIQSLIEHLEKANQAVQLDP